MSSVLLERSSNGYLGEGLLRRSVIKDGCVTDQLLFAITDRDLDAKAPAR